MIMEMLFSDDATLTSHNEKGLQRLIDQHAQAYQECGLIINLKKTNVINQEVSESPVSSIDDHTLEVVKEFTYQG